VYIYLVHTQKANYPTLSRLCFRQSHSE